MIVDSHKYIHRTHTHVIPIIHVGMNVSTSHIRYFFFFVVCTVSGIRSDEEMYIYHTVLNVLGFTMNRSVRNSKQHPGVDKKNPCL